MNIDGGNEWYWNLNLHRNQPILSNLPAVNRPKLPLPSALYTSAVLTDRGICVGMRNVNLRGAGHDHAPESHDIPTCYNGTNGVGERNKQTWTAAFERMRFSALTDPTMATTHCEPPFPHPQYDLIMPEHVIDNHIDFSMDNSCDTNQCPSSSKSIAAEFNPFHLFGDKSSLATINFSNSGPELEKIWNQSADFVTASAAYRSQANPLLTTSAPSFSSTQKPYPTHYHYLTDGDERLHGARPPYGHRNIIYKKSISSRSNSPSSFVTTNVLKATAAKLNRRLDKNVSRLNHVVAPKKKWIRNYMQSNSHLCFFRSFAYF